MLVYLTEKFSTGIDSFILQYAWLKQRTIVHRFKYAHESAYIGIWYTQIYGIYFYRIEVIFEVCVRQDTIYVLPNMANAVRGQHLWPFLI